MTGAIAALATCSAPVAYGQECEWEAMPGATFSSRVRSFAVFDEGAGPRLFVGGSFREATGSPTSYIARWDGASWTRVGGGLSQGAWAMTVFDDGSGPALYVTGPSYVGKWNGREWLALGSGLRSEDPSQSAVGTAITVFDDGTGPSVYVAGSFTEVDGIPVRNVARWNGSEWSSVGIGLPGYQIRAMAVVDVGAGPALYAGGYTPGGVWRWDGVAWESVGLGNVDAMSAFDDGTGAALYVGTQGLGGLNQWNGSGWSLVGGGTDFTVRSLSVFNDGAGPALYAGGNFSTAGGKAIQGIARWNGSEWSDLAGGIHGGGVDAIGAFDDGTGPALYAGGLFSEAGAARIPVENLARWRCSGCYADCDRSGQLDFFDFLCFQNEFAAMTSYADCDGSGGHDFFDFLCFQSSFAAGCE